MAPDPRLLLTVAFACTLVACGPGPPRLVLLYAPCSVDAGRLGPYAAEVAYTPNLDRFARESVVFSRHQTESGSSGIAYASLLSGVQADGHGVYLHPQKLDPETPLVAETFADAGWETWGFHAQAMAGAGLDYERGIPIERRSSKPLTAGPALDAILDGLEEDPSKRVFVTSLFAVSHWPYRSSGLRDFCLAHPPACARVGPLDGEVAALVGLYRELHMDLSYDFPTAVDRLGLSPEEFTRYTAVVEVLYAANLWRLDSMFGEVLDRLEERGLLEESVIAFTADHGERPYRENALFQWTHGHALAPEVIDVPLIVGAPGRLEAGRIEAVTRSIDVHPTLAGLAGIPLPSERPLAGRDLSPWLRRGVEPSPEPAFFHTALVRNALFERWQSWKTFRDNSPGLDPNRIWVGLRDGDQVVKLRYTGMHRGSPGFRPEVYDRASDPQEKNDLFDPRNAEHRQQIERLEAYKRMLVRDFEARRARGLPSLNREEQRDLLRSLGYVP